MRLSAIRIVARTILTPKSSDHSKGITKPGVSHQCQIHPDSIRKHRDGQMKAQQTHQCSSRNSADDLRTPYSLPSVQLAIKIRDQIPKKGSRMSIFISPFVRHHVISKGTRSSFMPQLFQRRINTAFDRTQRNLEGFRYFLERHVLEFLHNDHLPKIDRQRRYGLPDTASAVRWLPWFGRGLTFPEQRKTVPLPRLCRHRESPPNESSPAAL